MTKHGKCNARVTQRETDPATALPEELFRLCLRGAKWLKV